MGSENDRLRLHLDADTSRKALHCALEARGHDVTCTPNGWMALAAADEAQLSGVTEQAGSFLRLILATLYIWQKNFLIMPELF